MSVCFGLAVFAIGLCILRILFFFVPLKSWRLDESCFCKKSGSDIMSREGALWIGGLESYMDEAFIMAALQVNQA